jgi:hypothetical protein
MIGLFAILGLFALKIAFGLFGVLFAIFWVVLWWAIRIAIVGAVIYFIIRLVSPDTISKLRSRWS